jgi:hypothetical protein
MGVVLALVLSAAFGAGDQYLGSLTGSGHVWAAGWSSDISLLSAPWVVLAFAAGATQRDPRRAALLGLACTYAALLGYAVMTLSPVAIVGALVTAATLCLEPLARKVTIDPITHRDVWVAEVAVGLALAAAVLVTRFSHNQA